DPGGADGSDRPAVGERLQRPEAPRHRVPRGRRHLARHRWLGVEGGLIMTVVSVALALVVAAAGLLRWRRPAWYWMTFGVTLASLRVLVRYGTVMDACGLAVPPSRWRLALARATNRPAPESRPPRILLLRPTRTGLLLRLKLRPGQDAFDVAAAS